MSKPNEPNIKKNLHDIIEAFMSHVRGEAPVFVCATMNEEGRITTLVSINNCAADIRVRCFFLGRSLAESLIECGEKYEACDECKEKEAQSVRTDNNSN